MQAHLHPLDKVIIGLDKALRVMSGVAASLRKNPADEVADNPLSPLSASERRHSGALMRVNHVGEVCAQALYQAQSRATRSPALRRHFEQAAREEEDHLAWTVQRLDELGSHISVLNPLWYAGAYALGTMAARLGDARSLGFVVETERQVEAHLASHLHSLPVQDAKSRAIVEQMRVDEVAHGAAARSLGAVAVPLPVQKVMQGMAKAMTSTAYYL